MKHRLLDLIVCPECAGSLKVQAFSQHERKGTSHTRWLEINDGLLKCVECNEVYPIIHSVPRLLVGESKRALLVEYPYFFEKYQSHFSQIKESPTTNRNTDILEIDYQKRTRQSFGFEWTKFGIMRPEWEMNFRGYLSPKEPSFFKGKLILDAGCGMGRHTYYAAKYGGEVIGLDLSVAVDAAYKNTQEFSNAHIIQGDIYNMPFREDCFDFIYCLGVVPVLLNPESAIKNLVRYMKPGSEIRIYAYWNFENRPFRDKLLLSLVTAFRKITTRLPHKVLYGLTYLIAIGFFAAFVIPYRILSKLKVTREIAMGIPLRQYASYPFGVCHNDQFDRFSAPIENRHSKEQVLAMLEHSGLKDVSVEPNLGWLGTGKKL